MRMSSPEDMALRNVYNEVCSATRKECQDLGARFVEAKCTKKGTTAGRVSLTYEVTIDVTGLRRQTAQILKEAIDAELQNVIMDEGFWPEKIIVNSIGRTKLF